MNAWCPHCGEPLNLATWVELDGDADETVKPVQPRGEVKPRKSRKRTPPKKRAGSEYTRFCRDFVRGNYGTIGDAAQAWKRGQRTLTP